jgi:hypothetical protein
VPRPSLDTISPPPRPWRSSSLPSTGDDEALERAALLSASFHKFFGAQYGREQLPTELRPLSCGEASRALERVVQKRRFAVRSCLARMLASGYIPDPHNAEQFCGLAVRAVQPRRVAADDAIAELREIGKREYEAAVPLQVPAGAPRVPLSGPTVVTFQDNVFTVRKEIALPHHYNDVRHLIQPRNWKQLGPFWKQIEEEWSVVGGGTREGVIYEHFVIDWNNVAMQEYKVRLKATQRSKAGFIRTAYSLMYEEDKKLLVDEGYGQAEAIQDRPGWTMYTGEKTLKFASSFLNLLSPGVMGMFLDAQATGLHEALRRRKNRRRKRSKR